MPYSSSNGIGLTLDSPSFSNSSHHSAVSPRTAIGSLPMSPSTSQQSTPSLSKRSLSIKRKPVPAYLDNDILPQNGRALQNGHKATRVLSVDPSLGDEEILRSPVRVSFDHGYEDGASQHTPFTGFVKNSPQPTTSSTHSSATPSAGQTRNMGSTSLGGQSPVVNSITLNEVVNSRNGHSMDAVAVADHARRESEASMTSSISSGNSDFAQPNGSRPASAARNMVLRRSMYNLNSPEANNMSTDQLFTIPPHEDPSSRFRGMRASRSQPSLQEVPVPQASRERNPTEKPLDRQVSAPKVTAVDGGVESRNGSAGPLTGLGISGADLAPISPASEARPPSTHGSLKSRNSIHPTQSRLNRSLPSLPVSRTQSNLAAPPMQREKGIFKKKLAKLEDEFSESAVPTPMRLWEASQCHLVDESGRKRRFGDFWDTYAAQSHGGSDKTSGRKQGHVSMKSMARDLVGHHHRHAHQSQHPSGARQSIDGARVSVHEKNGSIHSSKNSQEPKIGGEEYIVHGRKTVVFWIRHFWCGQCAYRNRRSSWSG